MPKSVWIAAAAAFFAATPASAGQFTSTYTSLELEKCRIVQRFSDGGGGATWSCPGFAGVPVRVSEGDLRFFVSFGPRAEEQRAARQTLAPFNTIHKTLEWRLQERDGHTRPVATILRYFWDMDGTKGQTLVVTKLGAKNACHVAYVRADGNPQANEIARDVADTRTEKFDCVKGEPERIGNAAFVGSIPR